MNALPNQNIEVKARMRSLSDARDICRRIDAKFVAVLRQIDTYFHSTDDRRLKLRQINDDRAELITYIRPNLAAARTSQYTVEPIPDALAKLAALRGELGIQCIVHKRRELWMWHSVRIHLDEVDGLGTFLEFEGVVSSDADERLSRLRVDQLVGEFNISPADQIGGSYSDLILAG